MASRRAERERPAGRTVPAAEGLPLGEAVKLFARPDLVLRWRAAAAAAGVTFAVVRADPGRRPPYRAFRLDGGPPDPPDPAYRARAAACDAFNRARQAAVQDLIKRLCSGEYVAVGFHVGPHGRDPDKPRQEIPRDVFEDPELVPDFRRSEITGSGLKFVNVRVLALSQLPDVAPRLAGLNVSEAYRRFVLGDPEVRPIMLEAFEAPANRGMDADYVVRAMYDFGAPFVPREMPDESWKNSVSDFDVHLRGGTALDALPEETVRAFLDRRSSLVSRLMGLVRSGALAVRGTHQKTLDDTEVGPTWRQSQHGRIDFHSAVLLDRVHTEEGEAYDHVIFSNLTFVSPSDPQTPLPVEAPKGRPGRKPVWNDSLLAVAVVELADRPDGLPDTQAEIERYVAAKYLAECGKEPSESWIRERVVRILPPRLRKGR